MHKKQSWKETHTVDTIRILTIPHLGGFQVAYNFYLIIYNDDITDFFLAWLVNLCNTEQACATQHFSCNRPQQAPAAKTRSISTEAATHTNRVLGRQTCQAAWWTDLPSPLASAICHLSHLDHQLTTERNANETNPNK